MEGSMEEGWGGGVGRREGNRGGEGGSDLI